MKRYISVLNDVICIEDIKKIRILYRNGTDYSNKQTHYLAITYKDGEKNEYSTNDFERAKQDYENLKSALLEIDIEKGGD